MLSDEWRVKQTFQPYLATVELPWVTELGQVNFEVGLTHPAHPLVTSLAQHFFIRVLAGELDSF